MTKDRKVYSVLAEGIFSLNHERHQKKNHKANFMRLGPFQSHVVKVKHEW